MSLTRTQYNLNGTQNTLIINPGEQALPISHVLIPCLDEILANQVLPLHLPSGQIKNAQDGA